jgi:cysteine synthase
VRIFAAEPHPGDAVQGLRSLDEGFIPEIFDPAILDGKLLVSNAESIDALRNLTEREGIFAGVSSGGVLVAADRVARTMASGTIVTLLPDGGWKYLSEDLWTRDVHQDRDELESLNLW